MCYLERANKGMKVNRYWLFVIRFEEFGDLGKKARERIRSLFPLQKRRKELLEAVESVLIK